MLIASIRMRKGWLKMNECKDRKCKVLNCPSRYSRKDVLFDSVVIVGLMFTGALALLIGLGLGLILF
jgi:hypothetical protein